MANRLPRQTISGFGLLLVDLHHRPSLLEWPTARATVPISKRRYGSISETALACILSINVHKDTLLSMLFERITLLWSIQQAPPPIWGKTILAKSGCTKKSSDALRKIVNVKRAGINRIYAGVLEAEFICCFSLIAGTYYIRGVSY